MLLRPLPLLPFLLTFLLHSHSFLHVFLPPFNFLPPSLPLPSPSSFLTSSMMELGLCPRHCSSPGAIAMEKWLAFALAVNIHEREMNNKPIS